MRRAERARHISFRRCERNPGSERSFLAGETERVFEITNWTLGNHVVTVLEMLTKLA